MDILLVVLLLALSFFVQAPGLWSRQTMSKKTKKPPKFDAADATWSTASAGLNPLHAALIIRKRVKGRWREEIINLGKVTVKK